MLTILHLDDDPLELRHMRRSLEYKKSDDFLFQLFSVTHQTDFNLYLKQLKDLDIVILDIHLNSEKSGISLVSSVRKYHPHAIVVMSSNLDDPKHVLRSLQAGADEFLAKKRIEAPFLERLLCIREQAFLKKGISLKKQIQSEVGLSIAGEMMKHISSRIPKLVQSAVSSIYIQGESGTGKEVVADLLRQFLDQASNHMPFVKLNCGTISQSLLESELFGFVKGAFTGANADKQGVIEAASNGWLFLDEVSCLSESAQIALLRVLENQEVMRLGETNARKINVRFISASNIPLPLLVEKGQFRNDLWQRLCETEIILKPLRERKEEISELVSFFCKTMSGGPYEIEKTALNILTQLPWKQGNVRELRNCLRAMTEYHDHKFLSPLGIPDRILSESLEEDDNNETVASYSEGTGSISSVQIPIEDENGNLFTYDKIEKNLFKMIIERSENESGKLNLTKLARQLNVARSTLHSKIREITKSKNA
jgi:DNA-binding NtrC family response regulator